MFGRNGRLVAAFGGLIAILLLGAGPAPKEQPKSSADQPQASAQPNANGDERALAVSRESLAVDREANRIAERANLISEAQRSYALVQLVLGIFGVVFTAIAAGAAIAAAVFAKRAADAAAASAKADNEALAETRQAAAAAREDAAEAAVRFEAQMAKQQEMVEFTAKSSYAMEHSARASRGMATAMRNNADAALKAVEASSVQLELSRNALIVDQRPWVGVFGITLKGLEVNQEGAALEMTLRLKNTGKTPAHRVGIKVRLYAEPTIQASRDELIRIFHQSDRKPEYADQVMACIFPQQEHSADFKVLCDGEEIQAFPTIAGERRLLFTLTGFVIYESEVSGVNAVHTSSFIYRIVRQPSTFLSLGNQETFARFDEVHLKANHVSPGWYAD